ALRQKFIANLVQFVADHNLDGLDMDWEWEYNPVPDAAPELVAHHSRECSFIL
ncbi:MAG: hypothetical protein IKN34_11885, partial [Treponema sp.]|nr:hypothetical protein [Treponema sp.]